jgi:hypothetical protein
MKTLPLLGLASLLLATGCQSQAQYVNKHWSGEYVAPSMARHFLSYNPEMDGNYRDFAWEKKRAINWTIKRHFFNHNPENPFQPYDAEAFAPRPNNSLVPHPENYIHYEGIAMGAIIYGASGAFIPLPIDSIIGTFDEGGGKEFFDGVEELTRPLGQVTTSFLYDGIGFERASDQ